MSSRGSLLRRLNSAPSPTVNLLDAPSKENSLPSAAPIPDDQDVNSQDSGCADDPISQSPTPSFDVRFAVPSGFAPRKNSLVSPAKSILTSPGKNWPGLGMKSPEAHLSPSTMRFSPSTKRSPLRSLSFGSNDSFDDGFSEFADLDKVDENAPASIGSLLTGQLIGGKENEKAKDQDAESPFAFRPLRRAFSMVENQLHTTPKTPCSPDAKLSYKRPGELGVGAGNLKRYKQSGVTEGPVNRHRLQRSVSEDAASVGNLYGRPELIADYSKPYALPIIPGKHSDLTSITSDTLASVMRGEFSESVLSYTIVDCRYPYEFEAGHIRGAINLYTCDQIENHLLGPSSRSLSNSTETGRHILIFHCEFSQARGPSMYRWLRRIDRSKSAYPSLHYPEVYLLQGGYQRFHETHESLCEPTGYRPMQEPGFEADLRKFRVKASSWSVTRTSLKRLQLL